MVPPAARAGEFPGPLETLHRFHEQVRNQVLHGIDHATRFHDGHRGEFRQHYAEPSYHRRYDRRSYRPDAYRYGRPYGNGHVVIAPGAIAFEIRSSPPIYRDEYDRYHGCGREGYRDDDRRREDDRRRQDDRDYEDNY